MLTRVAQDAQRALLAVEHADGLLDDEAVAAAHRWLSELLGQDFDVDADGVPRLHRGTASGQIELSEHEPLMVAARNTLADPVTAEHLRRTRPRIKRLLGLLAHRSGAPKSRYIGSAKARLQAAWVAALVNLNPISRHLATQTA
jgi:hypothetical protein